jgi:kinesin family member 18/19
MQELFEKIEVAREEKCIELSLSYLEIYNETIRDLLVPGGSKQGLMLREDCNQAVSVAGLSSHQPKNVQEVMDIIVRGNEYRTMSPTEANATSSRSHAVLQINIALKDRNADMSEPHTMATLSIIDLAGSERASATKNRGERLIEGANINKSLLALGSCINALCDPRKRNHVPYRNSKLTRLLKFSLGGNCKTVMIVCVSPSSAHFDETQNTLRYANRAKNIQTKVTRNVYNVNRHVKDFLKKIDEQMALINELKQQQKENEAVAFAKFRKQTEKRDLIAREGIARLRSAYDHSAAERQERTNAMKKLRQVERRISLISAWVAGFDTVCETRDEEDPPQSLVAMRKTAQGMLAELETSRQHFHQRLAKNNWERAIDSALQNGLRQLKESEGCGQDAEVSSLIREAELLKSMADREASTVIMEQEKGGDAAIMQVLLQAHFDTIAILNQILHMSEDEAVRAARKLLGNIITACSTATSQVIKPDGGLPVIEAFPPTQSGTPKRRKVVNLLGPSPIRAFARPSLLEVAPVVTSSPLKSSPRRRRFGGAKKGVTFTPKKKSPVKGAKRGVRWKDDTEDGKLAEFQATPQPIDITPEVSSTEILPPPSFSVPTAPTTIAQRHSSSPVPTPPEASTDIRSRNSRFQAGFLSKKSDGSPLASVPPTSTLLNSSSDSDNSPLREIPLNKIPRPSTLQAVANMGGSSDVTPADSASNSSDSDNEMLTKSKSLEIDPKEIRSALKRTSSASGNIAAARAHRRRSPTGSGSPPSENMFSSSHARRMVKGGENGEWKSSVLSPRTAPITKAPVRRTTMGESAGMLRSGPVRVSSATPTGGATGRGSLAGSSKSVWR